MTAARDKCFIGIVMREDGSGAGAYWDHYTLQKTLGYPTAIVIAESEDEQHATPLKLLEYLRREVCQPLRFAGTSSDHPSMPPVMRAADCAVLVIAGVARNADTKERREFEESLLKLYYGVKPIILICGGVWRLTALGMGVGVVKHHSNARMVRLRTESGRVQHNTPVHYVEISGGAVSKRIWGDTHGAVAGRIRGRAFAVNSVHSKAIKDLGEKASEFEVVARSVDPVLRVVDGKQVLRRNRNGQDMHCERGCIEAIVSVRGPPLVAVQWHAEAYFADDTTGNPHRKLLRYAVRSLELSRGGCPAGGGSRPRDDHELLTSASTG